MNSRVNNLRECLNKVLKSKHKSKYHEDFASYFKEDSKLFITSLQNILYEIFERSFPNTIKSLLDFLIKSTSHLIQSSDSTHVMKFFIRPFTTYLISLCYSPKEKLRVGALHFLMLLRSSNKESFDCFSKTFTNTIEDLHYDKCKEVRCVAVEFAGNLHLHKIVLESMEIDPNANVRKKCMKMIEPEHINSKPFENRLKDTNNELRLLAISKYETLSIESIPNSALEIILHNSFNDSCEMVRSKCVAFINQSIDATGYKYLCQRLSLDFEPLSQAILAKLEGSEKDTKELHEQICKETMTGGEVEIFLLRVSGEAMRKFDLSIGLSIETTAVLIQEHKNNCFKAYNLLMILKCYDFFQEGNRLAAVNLFREICLQIKLGDFKKIVRIDLITRDGKGPEDIIETIVTILRDILKMHPHEYARIMKEFIDLAMENSGKSEKKDLKKTYDKNLSTHLTLKDESTILKSEIASNKIHINSTTKKEIITKIEEIENQLIKSEIKLEESAAAMYNTLYRALVIFSCTLKYSRIKELDGELEGLLESLILPTLDYANINIKFLSLKCLGYYCLLSTEALLRNLSKFVAEIESKSDLEVISIRFIFDFFLTHDLLGEIEFIKTLALVSKYLSSKDQEQVAVAVIGFTKLIMMDRLPKSIGILTKIIILFFSDIRSHVQTIILSFFEVFTKACEKNCTEFFRALMLYLSMKKNEKRLNFAVSINGKSMKLVTQLLDINNTQAITQRNLHFSMLFFLTKMAVNDDISLKVYEEAITDLNWNAFKPAQLDSVINMLKSRSIKACKLPKILIRVNQSENHGDNVIDVELNTDNEEKEYIKIKRYSCRFYNALCNYSEIGMFLCNAFEDVVLDGIIPRKRQRNEIEEVDLVEID